MNLPDLSRAEDPSFWRELCPELTIGDIARAKRIRRFKMDAETAKSVRATFLREGYIHIKPEHLPWQVDLALMAECVKRIHATGYLPLCSFLYDDFWLLYRHVSTLVEQILGEPVILFPTEVYTWLVPCRDDAGGWELHRDHGPRSLDAKGLSTSLSVWIPLTDATPLNGCMSCLPKHLDPHYDNKRQRLPRVDNPEFVRSLPGDAGSFFCWDSCLLHWGGSSSARAKDPRISTVMEYQVKRIADNTPLLPQYTTPEYLPTFSDRIRFVAGQLHYYFEEHAISEDWKRFAATVLTEDEYLADTFALDGPEVPFKPKFKRVHAPVAVHADQELADAGQITALKIALGMVPANTSTNGFDVRPCYHYIEVAEDGTHKIGWTTDLARVNPTVAWAYVGYRDAMAAAEAFEKLSPKRVAQAVKRPSRWVKHHGLGAVVPL